MSRCREVEPKTERLPLSDGDFIDVKQTLNWGETKKLVTSQFSDLPMGEKARINLEILGMTQVLAYLLGWSLLGIGGRPIPYSGPDMTDAQKLAALNKLDPDTFREIQAAIEAHHLADEQAREEKKSNRAGENLSAMISPSLVGAGGGTNG